jgi:small subunit ribosomal protein S6
MDPGMGEEKVSQLTTKIEDKIKALGGEIEKTEKWGIKRLASMIKKAKSLTQGVYTMIRFNSPAAVPAEIKAYLKVNESVIRSFLSRAVILPEPRPDRREIAGAPLAAVAVGEIKGEPFGEPK